MSRFLLIFRSTMCFLFVLLLLLFSSVATYVDDLVIVVVVCTQIMKCIYYQNISMSRCVSSFHRICHIKCFFLLFKYTITNVLSNKKPMKFAFCVKCWLRCGWLITRQHLDYMFLLADRYTTIVQSDLWRRALFFSREIFGSDFG